MLCILYLFISITCSIGESSSRVGVIDLRPKFFSDRIHLIGSGTRRSCDDNTIQMAVFPTIDQSEEKDSNPSYDDSEMDQQAAAAHCIGSLCNTVYLILSYDFEKEKTDLHRAFGGTKLMAFVDGTRKHWKTTRTKTKVILLLLPSSRRSENELQSYISTTTTDGKTIGETKMYDITKYVKDSSMLKGANVLLERLCSCFEYGGEEFQNVDPYDVQVLCSSGTSCDNSYDSEIDAMILKHQHKESIHFHSPTPLEKLESNEDLINSAYLSASGSGEITFK